MQLLNQLLINNDIQAWMKYPTQEQNNLLPFQNASKFYFNKSSLILIDEQSPSRGRFKGEAWGVVPVSLLRKFFF